MAKLSLRLLNGGSRVSDLVGTHLKLLQQLPPAPHCLLQLVLHHPMLILLLVLLGVVSLEVEEQVGLVDPEVEVRVMARARSFTHKAVLVLNLRVLKEANLLELWLIWIPVQLSEGRTASLYM